MPEFFSNRLYGRTAGVVLGYFFVEDDSSDETRPMGYLGLSTG